MFYLVYKTTNLINGKFYIGCHQTNDVNDQYLGSGKHLKRAIKKYGIDNFTKEILFFCSSKEEMFERERNLVNKDLVLDHNTYNLKIGGSGGNPGIVGAFAGRKHSEKSKDQIRQKALLQETTDQKRQKCSMNNWSRKEPELQREHARRIGSMIKSVDHRRKISESIKSQGKQITVQCPHCLSYGGERAMKRWHFDNCKHMLVRENGNPQVSKTLRTRFDS